MIHRVRSLVTVIALAVPTLAAAQPVAKKLPPAPAGYVGKYTYCDVKILSSLWKVSVGDAKASVQTKLAAKNEAYVTKQLANARTNAVKNAAARCTFAEAGFTPADAKALAKHWKKSESDAKALAEQKIAGGLEQWVRELAAKQGGGGAPAQEDPTSTFLKQDKYNYCDVKLLAALWKSSVSDAKATVGTKLQAGSEKYLQNELARARKNPKQQCSYDEVGFTYADVETLATKWKMSVEKAKVKINKKVTTNGTEFLREALGGPGTQQQKELDAYFAQEKYRYCDAAMIAGMWKQSVTDAKAFIGMKLQSKNTAAIDNVLVKAREHAVKNPVDGCQAFVKPGSPKPPAPPPAPPKK